MSLQPAYREDDVFMFEFAVETMPRRDLEAFQLERLKWTLKPGLFNALDAVRAERLSDRRRHFLLFWANPL